LKVVENVFIEPFVKDFKAGDRFQFDRTGYFCMDKDSTNDKPVFNRTVSLKDSWGKTANKTA
jgi:glutaminyl-tRNA synthetase